MDGCQHCTPCALARIESALSRMEIGMATAKQQIDELSTKVDGLSSVTADVAQDFQAFKTAMEAERENLTADGQAALDSANAKIESARAQLADLDVAVGDADGSDTPSPAPGEDTDEAPAPGDEDTDPAAGLPGGAPVTVPNPESGQPSPEEQENPGPGEGTVVSPDAPVDGSGGESDARPTV